MNNIEGITMLTYFLHIYLLHVSFLKNEYMVQINCPGPIGYDDTIMIVYSGCRQ